MAFEKILSKILSQCIIISNLQTIIYIYLLFSKKNWLFWVFYFENELIRKRKQQLLKQQENL